MFSFFSSLLFEEKSNKGLSPNNEDDLFSCFSSLVLEEKSNKGLSPNNEDDFFPSFFDSFFWSDLLSNRLFVKPDSFSPNNLWSGLLDFLV